MKTLTFQDRLLHQQLDRQRNRLHFHYNERRALLQLFRQLCTAGSRHTQYVTVTNIGAIVADIPNVHGLYLTLVGGWVTYICINKSHWQGDILPRLFQPNSGIAIQKLSLVTNTNVLRFIYSGIINFPQAILDANKVAYNRSVLASEAFGCQ